ncbi:MAG: hypothetical protein JOZ58_19985 [Acetobacteraceae bacterium]|nr:hypothetical protein [Acetobacteraceae bacterium]
MTGKDGELVQVIDARGWQDFGKDPVAAFDRMEQWAAEHTESRKPFFHGHIRLAPGERLTDPQWMDSLDRMEKRLGFEGQPRIVSFHIEPETGEKHLHAAWFRGDLENERAIDPGLYKNKLMQLSRTLEREFGLRELTGERQPHEAREADRNEYEESKRLGTDVRAIRNGILDCLEHADSGKAFKAALEERSLMLANGDRRDCFVVIDEAGGHHALNKKLTGMSLAETRERLADLDRTQLPGVEQAIALQLARAAEMEQRREAVGRTDEIIRPDRSAEIDRQAAQPDYAAAKGRVDDVRPLFEAAAARVTEPAAPIYDRDAAGRMADEKIIDSAIAAAEDTSRRSEAKAEARQTPEAAPQAEKHGRGVEMNYSPPPSMQPQGSAPDSGLRDADNITSRIFGGLASAAEKFVDWLGDMLFPAPPPTADQAERMVRSAEEKQQAHAEQAAHQERSEAQHWLVEEARRQAAQEREEAERAKTAAELYGTPRSYTQEQDNGRERDRGYELER